jgi:hypothetical protein
MCVILVKALETLEMRALGILLLASLAEHCQAAVAARIWVSSVDMCVVPVLRVHRQLRRAL